jgi:hypothetical protein
VTVVACSAVQMVKHNNQVPNAHFHKEWKNRVKTWFDQVSRRSGAARDWWQHAVGVALGRAALLTVAPPRLPVSAVISARQEEVATSCTQGEGGEDRAAPRCWHAATCRARPDDPLQHQGSLGPRFLSGGAQGA